MRLPKLFRWRRAAEGEDSIRARGDIEIQIEYNDGRPTETLEVRNTILRAGRVALANCLANNLGETFQYFISRMTFGNGGTNNGIPKFVDEGRSGLFGLTVVSKGVIATIDNANPSQAVFTSVIGFNEGNNSTINEMALQMANGELYSMRTFPDLNKTNQMQLVLNWKMVFI